MQIWKFIIIRDEAKQKRIDDDLPTNLDRVPQEVRRQFRRNKQAPEEDAFSARSTDDRA